MVKLMAFFNPEKFANEAVAKLKTELSDKAIIAASGGVDSTVAAVLAAKAVKDSLLAIYVDTGYMRVGESEYVSSMLSELGVQHKVVDASEQFYAGLKGVIDPEEKRKIIGELFIRVFEKEAEEYGGKFLGSRNNSTRLDRIRRRFTRYNQISSQCWRFT